MYKTASYLGVTEQVAQAVENLGVDFDRYSEGFLTKCAQANIPPEKAIPLLHYSILGNNMQKQAISIPKGIPELAAANLPGDLPLEDPNQPPYFLERPTEGPEGAPDPSMLDRILAGVTSPAALGGLGGALTAGGLGYALSPEDDAVRNAILAALLGGTGGAIGGGMLGGRGGVEEGEMGPLAPWGSAGGQRFAERRGGPDLPAEDPKGGRGVRRMGRYGTGGPGRPISPEQIAQAISSVAGPNVDTDILRMGF